MASPLDMNEFHAKLRRLELLVQECEEIADLSARTRVSSVVHALLDLHATGLSRLLEHMAAAGKPGTAILDACAADDVVGGLFLLHSLHPLNLDDRVGKAVEQLKRSIASGEIELVGIDDGIARIRVEWEEGASPIASCQQIEEMILALAPELTAVEIEGMTDMVDGRVALPVL